MIDDTADAAPLDTDVKTVRSGEMTVHLVGTAHVSERSRQLVERVIRQVRPDVVCVELDEKRYQALARPDRWRELDLKAVIRRRQLAVLLVNLVLSAYQKRLGGRLGVVPGGELLAAVRTAEALGIPTRLCDREVGVTLRRAWRATGFWRKGMLLATLFASLFDRQNLDEDELARMRDRDVLTELLEEIGRVLPQAKQALIDERDRYMAEKIRRCGGRLVVAVVGAGHVEGMAKALTDRTPVDLDALDTLPPPSAWWKAAAWGVPVLIIGSILAIGFRHGVTQATVGASYWILANGVPSAIGAALALGHPATVCSAFLAAPITSLTPVIGAGYVTAFVQVMTMPPLVREFETASRDLFNPAGWWRNRLLRIFLVFLLSGLGSSIGTWIGGVKILGQLFG